MTTLQFTNSPEALRERLAADRTIQFGPYLLLVARPILALAAQGLALMLLIQFRVPEPSIAVRNWWTVYGSLVDLGCLALLVWLLNREGIRLQDLIGFERDRLKRDILIGLGIFALVFPLTVFGGGMLASLLAYGSLQADLPQGAFIRTLPVWAVLYSRLLWWPVWSFTEELTFQGYTLPRLQALTSSTWLPVILVSFFWALQHSFLPWINLRHAVYLLITFLPLTISLPLIYLRVRRLPGLILGHWLMDLASVLFMLRTG